MLKGKAKSKIMETHARHERDTGSAEVQAALFTEQIEELVSHLKKHRKDNSSRVGLLKMIAKRKKLMDYLRDKFPGKYAKLTKELGLK
ncbi:MAG: ribosomal protein S15 [Parcubacteria group bacterium Licking1014_17]|nr:MAG: ribosomal protein S15 [Parcubacteria group bacterium Licking1014_17]